MEALDSWSLWGGIWQLSGLSIFPVGREGDLCGGSLRLCCFTHCRISYRTSPERWKHGHEHKDTKLVITLSLCTLTHLPELGQRRLKSSLVRRHRARPFISKQLLSSRHSEYSFWAQCSQWATSALSHRDGFIPAKKKKKKYRGCFSRGWRVCFVCSGTLTY